MLGFARFTAIIFMLLGVGLLSVGAIIAFGGLTGSPASAASSLGLAPNLSGLVVLAGAIAGGVVAFQGLLVAAVGQVLWLMASMAENAQLSIEYMAELVNRMGNAKR